MMVCVHRVCSLHLHLLFIKLSESFFMLMVSDTFMHNKLYCSFQLSAIVDEYADFCAGSAPVGCADGADADALFSLLIN